MDGNRTAELREALEKAWADKEETKAIKIKGLQIRGDKLRIFTATAAEADILRRHDSWVRKALEGAHTRGEEWYPIRIDSVQRSSAVSEGDKVSEKFLESFSMENGVGKIHKAFWLSTLRQLQTQINFSRRSLWW